MRFSKKNIEKLVKNKGNIHNTTIESKITQLEELDAKTSEAKDLFKEIINEMKEHQKGTQFILESLNELLSTKVDNKEVDTELTDLTIEIREETNLNEINFNLN